jgi:hypothetical protein
MTSHRPAVAEDRWIEFVRWPYEDEAWHVTVRAADEQYRAEQEFYVFPADLLEFAHRLRVFPQTADVVSLDVGSKESGWAHWVFIRAFTIDVTGHGALGFDLGSAGDPLRTRSAAFVISCDVASLNRLGVALALWVENSATPIREYLYSS